MPKCKRTRENIQIDYTEEVILKLDRIEAELLAVKTEAIRSSNKAVDLYERVEEMKEKLNIALYRQ